MQTTEKLFHCLHLFIYMYASVGNDWEKTSCSCVSITNFIAQTLTIYIFQYISIHSRPIINGYRH